MFAPFYSNRQGEDDINYLLTIGSKRSRGTSQFQGHVLNTRKRNCTDGGAEDRN